MIQQQIKHALRNLLLLFFLYSGSFYAAIDNDYEKKENLLPPPTHDRDGNPIPLNSPKQNLNANTSSTQGLSSIPPKGDNANSQNKNNIQQDPFNMNNQNSILNSFFSGQSINMPLNNSNNPNINNIQQALFNMNPSDVHINPNNANINPNNILNSFFSGQFMNTPMNNSSDSAGIANSINQSEDLAKLEERMNQLKKQIEDIEQLSIDTAKHATSKVMFLCKNQVGVNEKFVSEKRIKEQKQLIQALQSNLNLVIQRLNVLQEYITKKDESTNKKRKEYEQKFLDLSLEINGNRNIIQQFKSSNSQLPNNQSNNNLHLNDIKEQVTALEKQDKDLYKKLNEAQNYIKEIAHSIDLKKIEDEKKIHNFSGQVTTNASQLSSINHQVDGIAKQLTNTKSKLSKSDENISYVKNNNNRHSNNKRSKKNIIGQKDNHEDFPNSNDSTSIKKKRTRRGKQRNRTKEVISNDFNNEQNNHPYDDSIKENRERINEIENSSMKKIDDLTELINKLSNEHSELKNQHLQLKNKAKSMKKSTNSIGGINKKVEKVEKVVQQLEIGIEKKIKNVSDEMNFLSQVPNKMQKIQNQIESINKDQSEFQKNARTNLKLLGDLTNTTARFTQKSKFDMIRVMHNHKVVYANAFSLLLNLEIEGAVDVAIEKETKTIYSAGYKLAEKLEKENILLKKHINLLTTRLNQMTINNNNQLEPLPLIPINNIVENSSSSRPVTPASGNIQLKVINDNGQTLYIPKKGIVEDTNNNHSESVAQVQAVNSDNSDNNNNNNLEPVVEVEPVNPNNNNNNNNHDIEPVVEVEPVNPNNKTQSVVRNKKKTKKYGRLVGFFNK